MAIVARLICAKAEVLGLIEVQSMEMLGSRGAARERANVGNEWTPGDWQMKEWPWSRSAISTPMAARLNLLGNEPVFQQRLHAPGRVQRTSIRSARGLGQAPVLRGPVWASHGEWALVAEEAKRLLCDGATVGGAAPGGAAVAFSLAAFVAGSTADLLEGTRCLARAVVDVATEVVVERRLSGQLDALLDRHGSPLVWALWAGGESEGDGSSTPGSKFRWMRRAGARPNRLHRRGGRVLRLDGRQETGGGCTATGSLHEAAKQTTAQKRRTGVVYAVRQGSGRLFREVAHVRSRDKESGRESGVQASSRSCSAPAPGTALSSELCDDSRFSEGSRLEARGSRHGDALPLWPCAKQHCVQTRQASHD